MGERFLRDLAPIQRTINAPWVSKSLDRRARMICRRRDMARDRAVATDLAIVLLCLLAVLMANGPQFLSVWINTVPILAPGQ